MSISSVRGPLNWSVPRPMFSFSTSRQVASNSSGCRGCTRFQDGIQKPGLIKNFSRLGRIDRGATDDVNTPCGKSANGTAQIFFTIAKVGTEREKHLHTSIMGHQ